VAPIAAFAMARATTTDAQAEIALLTSYLRQPGSARAFSRTVRDVIRWRGQTRNLFDGIAEIDELPPFLIETFGQRWMARPGVESGGGISKAAIEQLRHHKSGRRHPDSGGRAAP
jgi:hypothetical protein